MVLKFNLNNLMQNFQPIKKILSSVLAKIFIVSLIISLSIFAIIVSLIYWVSSFREDFLFDIFFPFSEDDRLEIILVVLFIIFILLLACYLTIRQIIKPLTTLHQGVKELAQGNLAVHLPAKQKDEFGEIMRSFNQMTKKLSELVISKKQLLLDLSHELRTPITRAKLSLEFLKQSKSKQNLKEDLQEMEFMIHSILEAEKLDKNSFSLQLEEVSLNKFIQNLLVKYHKTGSNIKYKTSLLANSCYYLDPLKLKILLNNLIQNAINYAKPQKVKQKPILVESKIVDNKLQLIVQDCGIGISQQELTKIFEPFYRVEKSRFKQNSASGYGLGLNICQRIVNAHQGKIKITSKLGEGTLVLVSLPLNLNK